MPRAPKSPHFSASHSQWSPMDQAGSSSSYHSDFSTTFSAPSMEHTGSNGSADDEGASESKPMRSRGGTMSTPADGESASGGKAKPLARGSACIICRKRKLKCDGIRPRCGTCVRLKHDCQYGDPLHEKLAERTRELEEQVRSLEAELQHYRSSVQPEFSPDMRSPQHFPSLALHNPAQGSVGGFHGETTSPYAAYDEARERALASGSSGVIPLPLNTSPHTQQSFAFAHSPHQEHRPSPRSRYPPPPLNSDVFPLPPPPQGVAETSFPPFVDNGFPSSSYPGPRSPLSHQALPGAFGGVADSFEHRSPEFGQSGTSLRRLTEQSNGEGRHLSALGGHGLPSTELLIELTGLYFGTVGLHLPFLNRPRFIYALHNPSSLVTLSLVFAVLAAAAPYHNSPAIQAKGIEWYNASRASIEESLAFGVQPSGAGKASVTVEMVQSLCLLTLIEMGRSDHQRAFFTIGQAVRVAAILGLHRMDEDRIVAMTSGRVDTRLRPPALHALPEDPVLLEECRRTMCTVFCIDRFESSCVGWPSAIAEEDIRLLLPCREEQYEAGTCTARDNALWWPIPPSTLESEEAEGIQLGGFAWLCRVVWLAGRITSQTYRPSGDPVAGPFNTANMTVPLEDVGSVLDLDRQLDSLRSHLNQLVSSQSQSTVNAPLVQVLLILNCLFANLHHLRVTHGLSTFPFDHAKPSVMGSAEYSMQRCLEGIHSVHEIIIQLASYDNLRTSLSRSRVSTFSSFLPYVSFCFAFPAKFTIGDWALLGKDRTRVEQLSGRIVEGNTTHPLPSGDDVFGPALDDERLVLIDAFCDALDRLGVVWTVADKFSKMVRGDRQKLAARVAARRHKTST